MVKLVTELYKSTPSVVCDFHFPRILFFFFNPSRLACSDNTEVSRKMSQFIRQIMVAGLNPKKYVSAFCIILSARKSLLKTLW